MVPVYLKRTDNQEFFTNNSVTLESLSFACTTTKAPAQGNWYYEIKHISGDNRHVFGYSINENHSSSFFVQATHQQLFLFSYGSITMSLNSTEQPNGNYTSLPFVLDDNYIIGVAYNSMTKLFSIYYKEHFVHIQVNHNFANAKVVPYFIEGTAEHGKYSDTIELNFGESQFEYDTPFGYKSWQSMWGSLTCNMRKRIIFSEVLFYILLL